MITNEAYERYLKLLEINAERIISLHTSTFADLFLLEALDCFILGFYDVCTFLCGRSLEEVFAWKYYEEMKSCHGKQKAIEEVKSKDFACLIKWAEDKNLISAEEKKMVDAIKLIRHLNAHASIIMMTKIQEKLDSGDHNANVLAQVMPREMKYPDWFMELYKEVTGHLPNSKKPAVGWLLEEETAFNVLKATIQIIEQITPKENI